jgi:hypothetical protein
VDFLPGGLACGFMSFILFGPWHTFMAPLYSAFLLHPPSRWRLFLHAAVIAQAVVSAVLIFPPPSFYPSFSPPDAPRLLSIDDYIRNYGHLFFVVFFIFSTGASVVLGLRAAEVDGVSRRLYRPAPRKAHNREVPGSNPGGPTHGFF